MNKPHAGKTVILAFASIVVSVLSTAHAQQDLKDIFRSALTCALVEPILADMPVKPVYTQVGTDCAAVTPDSKEIPYFSDASCQVPVSFTNTTLLNHCELLLDSNLLGEGGNTGAPTWTLSPGSRLDLGARSLDGVPQPYLQRREFRTVQTPRGSCSLEMRVYADSPQPNENVTRPSLLALHGGSWSARGFGFFGLELTIPHYVQQGFVVYAPFYRLLGNAEGSVACNQSTIGEIADDAAAALAWVEDHASEYQSAPIPVVFGQSAGAHLATSLLVNEPDKVAGAVLFYPPTDFTDFALRAQQGFYTDEQGLDILERVLATEAHSADVSASPIPENSFPIRIVEQAIEVPPVMMVHGMRDSLVEARQSVRLCDALSGQLLQGPETEVATLTTLRKRLACGESSQLQLIREGQHALDVCFTDSPIPTDFCPSGSRASRDEVSLAIGDAVAFAYSLASADVPEGLDVDTDNPVASESGGGALSWLVLILAMPLWFSERNR